jgi:methyl-accepting chemotaxis protein
VKANSWTIRSRIIAGFGAILVVAAGFGLYAVERLSRINTDASNIWKSNLPAMERASTLQKNIQLLGDKSSGLFTKEIMSPSDELRADFALQIQTNLAVMQQMAESYSGQVRDADERGLYSRFESAQLNYVSVFKRGMELCSSGRPQDAMELKEGELEPALTAFLQTANALEDFNQKRGETAAINIQSAVSSARTSVWIGLLAVLISAGVISMVIIMGTTKILTRVTLSLSEAAERLSETSALVSAGSHTVAQNCVQQAASLEEVNATLEEMTSISIKNSHHAETAASIAQQTHSTAGSGSKHMSDLDTAIQDINSASDDIAAIIKTIDSIAFQTNILALNAAVEAARAGEAGLGFAVVANEVRTLAQRSAQAAHETAERIQGTITKTARTAQLSRQLKDTFVEIVKNANEVNQLDQNVAGYSKEQADGIRQVTTAVSALEKTTQANAANSEESAATVEELHAQSSTLKQNINELQQLVGGAPAPVSAPSMPPRPPSYSGRPIVPHLSHGATLSPAQVSSTF